ncbi:MAG: hypothetical protein A2046_11970 [Bacteroidetes bacterium GWA2_30_7]|nr:MAG: hypothetical protein A2046_11970 [Bacteroidetes bacterium GWA2_30_7]
MKTNIKKAILVLTLASIVILGCKKKDEEPEPEPTVVLPTVSTTAISNLAETTAVSGGNITNDGGATVTGRGVCWSTNQNPTISDSKTSDGTGIGAFTSNITGLSANTSYYVRAYATNSAGTGYGSELSTTNNTYNLTYKVDGTLIKCSDGKGAADGWFTISGKDAANPTIRYFRITLPLYDSLKVTTYNLAENPAYPNAKGYYVDYSLSGENEFESIDGQPVTDKITITKYDKSAKKISGTFNFTLTANDGVTKKVFTEGTFTDLTW